MCSSANAVGETVGEAGPSPSVTGALPGSGRGRPAPPRGPLSPDSSTTRSHRQDGTPSGRSPDEAGPGPW